MRYCELTEAPLPFNKPLPKNMTFGFELEFYHPARGELIADVEEFFEKVEYSEMDQVRDMLDLPVEDGFDPDDHGDVEMPDIVDAIRRYGSEAFFDEFMERPDDGEYALTGMGIVISSWASTAEEIIDHLPHDMPFDEVWETSDASAEYDDFSVYRIMPDHSLGGGDDGTLPTAQGSYGMEIVSPVFRDFDEMLKALKTIIARLPDMKTTNKTGFHINMSVPDIHNIDKLKLALFADSQWLNSQYGREDNGFAHPNLAGLFAKKGSPLTAEELSAMLSDQDGKSHAINFSKLERGYLEFRSMGGADYHTDLGKLANNIRRIAHLIGLAIDPNAHKEEYRRRLLKLKAEMQGADFEQNKQPPYTTEVNVVAKVLSKYNERSRKAFIDDNGKLVAPPLNLFFNLLGMDDDVDDHFMRIVGNLSKAYEDLDGYYDKAGVAKYRDFLIRTGRITDVS